MRTGRDRAVVALMVGVDLGPLSRLSGERRGLPARENIKEQRGVGEEAVPPAPQADPAPSRSRASLPQQARPSGKPGRDEPICRHLEKE